MKQKKWWHNSVVYNIYPLSFMDSNNDGVGDINGITKKLGYIKDLGVDMIWMCPIFESPMMDNGYDISDYYKINPMLGTNHDFDELLKEAKKHDLKIILDLVLNHCSNQHPWFKEAYSNPNSKYRDYFIFRKGKNGTPPNNLRCHFGGSIWERVENSDDYYMHAYSKEQPDMNWDSEALKQELFDAATYWLEKGIGGYRLDAVHNMKKIIEYKDYPVDGEDGLADFSKHIQNYPGIEDYFQEFKRKVLDKYDAFIVAEALVAPDRLDIYIGNKGFASAVFDFTYANIDLNEEENWFEPLDWTKKQFKDTIFKCCLKNQELGFAAPYFENLDQNRSIDKYLVNDEKNFYSTSMLGSIFMGLNGIPFLYQGQEIGMRNIFMDSIDKYNDISTKNNYLRALKNGLSEEEAKKIVFNRSRDNSRTPMQWDDSLNAGFNKGTKTWLEVNENYKVINVQDQLRDKNSLLNYYKKLIKLRRSDKYADILAFGEFIPINNAIEEVIIFDRVLPNQSIRLIYNFQNKNQKIDICDSYSKVIFSNYENFGKTDFQILKPYEFIVLEK